MEIGFYSHQGHTTTFDSTIAALKGKGVDAGRLECLCSLSEVTKLPATVVVDPSYTERSCWESVRELAERNPDSRVYVTPFCFADQQVVSEMRTVLGNQRNVTYVPYADIAKTLLELVPKG